MLAQTGAFSLGRGVPGPGLESPRSSKAGRGLRVSPLGTVRVSPSGTQTLRGSPAPHAAPPRAATLAAGVSRLSPAPEWAERAVVSARLPLLSLLGAGSRRKAGVWGKARTFLALDAA